MTVVTADRGWAIISMMISLDEKRRAILAAGGNILILGGPGSGKTTIALLKAERISSTLLSEQRLLFLSFSRAAVQQILGRCQEILNAETRGKIEIKTYHAFCMEVLRSHGKLLTGKTVSVIFPEEERIAKSEFHGSWGQKRARLAKEDAKYCFDLFAAGVADLLNRCAAFGHLLSSRYPTVIIDEFQDTDDEQWRLVQALASVSQVICLADKDQCIYNYKKEINLKRVENLREKIGPQVFDLGKENYRSPQRGIYRFAGAVLDNVAPLPEKDDVKVFSYRPDVFNKAVHIAVIHTSNRLRASNINNPRIAVLARTNAVVADISSALTKPQKHGGSLLPPIAHTVVWDADLSAAAARVVTSVMEWSDPEKEFPVASTLEAIAYFYKLKKASRRRFIGADRKMRQFQEAAEKVRKGGIPLIKDAKKLMAAYETGSKLVGDPVQDWKVARDLLNDGHGKPLTEIFTASFMVRLFQATDAVGNGLADIWVRSGHYGSATELISDILKHERIHGDGRESADCILMTMHKSKGKEFDGVVIAEKRHRGAFFDKDRELPPFKDTRRLLFVAITRARSYVTIIRPHGAAPLV